MATRPSGFGLTAELDAKKRDRYDIETEKDIRKWIERCTGRPLSVQDIGEENFHEAIKDGVELCHLANTIQPGSVKKINSSKMAFKQMENIGYFLEMVAAYGVPSMFTFQTVDLFEQQNMPQVLDCLRALRTEAEKKGFKPK
ncbi:calponin-3-like [Glandiceps talaboti]